jgi:histone deacetylase complex regulatory component SIN3
MFLPKDMKAEGARAAGSQAPAEAPPREAPARFPPRAKVGQNQPPEFDKAIIYVTKIKKRFVNDVTYYKQFLDLLNKYQHTQSCTARPCSEGHVSIKDVLDKVVVLFKDHPDLLRDFTDFLPDSVQEQSKERILRTVEAYERRQKDNSEYGRGGLDGVRGGPAAPGMMRERAREAIRARDREYAGREDGDRVLSAKEAERERERERILERARDRSQVGMGPGKLPRMSAIVRKRRGRDDEIQLTLTPSERSFFDRVKAVLGSREMWGEFLKCLELFSTDVLTKAELLVVVQDVLSGTGAQAGKLVDELKHLLSARGASDLTSEDTWYTMPIAELDLSACPRCTPSYRRLPAGFPRLACSDRSRLEQSVLNDDWVSVPTGSEDFNFFKITRKNEYEMALFKCEDERHEVDMVIENNAATIRVLEPLAEEIATLREATSKATVWQFRLDRRSLGVVHLKAIARVYGEHGTEILELLRKNPADAIPIVLARLRQKDDEWRKARVELNKGWKDVMDRNYYKSLDHRSFYFKQADKKAQLPKNLIGEIKSKADQLDGELREYLRALADAEAEEARAAAGASATTDGSGMAVDGAASNAQTVAELIAATTGTAKLDAPANVLGPSTSIAASILAEGKPLPAALRAKLRSLEPVLYAHYHDTRAHKDAFSIISYAVERSAGAGERDKAAVAELWRSFLAPFFNFPREWLAPGALLGYAHGFGLTSGAAGSAFNLLQIGDLVKTPFGRGLIADVRVTPSGSDAASPIVMYEVWLPFGSGFINADVVSLATPVKPASGSGATPKTSTRGGAASAAASNAGSGSATAAPTAAGTVVVSSVAGGFSLGSTHFVAPGDIAAPAVPGTCRRPSPSNVFYASSTLYVFFRLHQMLVDRLTTACLLCSQAKARDARALMHPDDRAVQDRATGSKGAPPNVVGVVPAAIAESVARASGIAGAVGDGIGRTGAALAASVGDLTGALSSALRAGDAASGGMDVDGPSDDTSESAYQHFLTSVYNVLDGHIDGSKFEQDCSDLMGTSAYKLYTFDKLAQSSAKQLLSVRLARPEMGSQGRL